MRGRLAEVGVLSTEQRMTTCRKTIWLARLGLGVGVGVTVGEVGGVVVLLIELPVSVALLLKFAKVIPPYPSTIAARSVSVAILRKASG